MLLTYSLAPYKLTIMDHLGHIAKTSNASDRLSELGALPKPTNAEEFHRINHRRARIQQEMRLAHQDNVKLRQQLLLRTIEAVLINGFEENVLSNDLYLTSLEIVETISDTVSGEARANVAAHIRDSLLHLIVGLENLLVRVRRDVERCNVVKSLDINQGSLHVLTE